MECKCGKERFYIEHDIRFIFRCCSCNMEYVLTEGGQFMMPNKGFEE